MTMMKPVSLAVAAILLAAGGLAGSAAAMTLPEALASAYLNNPELQAERARVRGVDESVPQALSGWRPTVSVNGSVGYNNSTSNLREKRTQDAQPRQGSLTVTQPLFNGFRTLNQTEAAENQVLAAREQLRVLEQRLFSSVAEAYLNVVRDRAEVELKSNNEQVLQRQLAATRDRFRVGEITRTDVSQAESRLAGATASRIAAESQLSTSRATFERLVGLPPEQLTTPAAAEGLPGSLQDAVGLATSEQPAVLAAEYAARAAVETVDAATGELLPTVALQGTAFRNFDDSTDQSRSNGYQVVATVAVPLYEAGGTYSRISEAKHTAGQRRLIVEQTRQQSRESAVQAWEQLQAHRAQITSLQAQVRAAEVALEGVEREAQVGARTVLDVLDAEQELLDARVGLVRAQRNERVSTYALLSAVGRLNARDMALPVELYDPVAHYDDVRGRWIGSSDAADEDVGLARKPLR